MLAAGSVTRLTFEFIQPLGYDLMVGVVQKKVETMKMVLSGVETNNKGAELMLYAILQEIERKWPDAIVYIPKYRINHGLDYVKTSLDFRYIPFERFESKLHLVTIFNKLKISFKILPHMIAMGKVDYFIDGSGFLISDQFSLSKKFASIMQKELSAYWNKGTKIIYLPQAFGPFEKRVSIEVLSALSNNATILMPREKVSMKYIANSGVVDMKKVRLFTDFTSLVEGIFPTQYEHLRQGVCIIPNKQMINKGVISMTNYLSLLKNIIQFSKKSGRVVYLLNHEGENDEQLCRCLQYELSGDIESVFGLNALEVKGLISSAYLVISSRFHGVASSLNSCVPCLATSWSHKYMELFNDYNMTDSILSLDDLEVTIKMITDYLKEEKNQAIRNTLSVQVPIIKKETIKMWECVWSC